MNFSKGYVMLDYDISKKFKLIATLKLYKMISGFINIGQLQISFLKLKMRLLKDWQNEKSKKEEEEDEKIKVVSLFPTSLKSVKQYKSVYDFNKRVLDPAIAELKEKGNYFCGYKFEWLKEKNDYSFTFYIKENSLFREYNLRKKLKLEGNKIEWNINRLLLRKLFNETSISAKELRSHYKNLIIYIERNGQDKLIDFLLKIYSLALDLKIDNPKGYVFNSLDNALNSSKDTK